MKEAKKISIPDKFENLDKWEVNRRSFLRTTLIAGAASQLAWFTSCSAELEEANDFLTAEQSTILKSILSIIWPDDGNGPSIDDLNTFGYILWVLDDHNTSQEENDYIIEGIDWANQTALEIYGDEYVNLSVEEKENLTGKFTELNWGKNWMSVMVTLTLESLLLDPIYGGNKDEAGWNWLDHVSGQPRPTELTRLESFTEKYKPNA